MSSSFNISLQEWGQLAFEKFAKCLSYRFTHIAVILVTLGLFAAGVYGSVLIRAGIDEKQLLPIGTEDFFRLVVWQ